MYGDYIRYLIL